MSSRQSVPLIALSLISAVAASAFTMWIGAAFLTPTARVHPTAVDARPGTDQLQAQLDQLRAMVDRLTTSPLPIAPDNSGELAALRNRLLELHEELLVLAATTSPAGPETREAPITRQDWLVAQTRITRLEQEVAALRQMIMDLAAGMQPTTPPESNPGAAQWGVQQLLGPPDTPPGVDRPTAWAPASADGGREWIEIDIPAAITPDAIVIHETLNPGFVTRVEMRDSSGYWHRVWAGADPSTAPGGPLVVPVHNSFASRSVRVWLDTSKRTGWNEVDAIGMRANGTTHWATAARTSSTWSNTGTNSETAEDEAPAAIDDYRGRLVRRMEVVID